MRVRAGPTVSATAREKVSLRAAASWDACEVCRAPPRMITVAAGTCGRKGLKGRDLGQKDWG